MWGTKRRRISNLVLLQAAVALHAITVGGTFRAVLTHGARLHFISWSDSDTDIKSLVCTEFARLFLPDSNCRCKDPDLKVSSS
jgi:hypothetical protein